MKRLFLIRSYFSSRRDAEYRRDFFVISLRCFAPLREICCSELVAHSSLLIFNLNSAYPNIHSSSISSLM